LIPRKPASRKPETIKIPKVPEGMARAMKMGLI
jgi:hypothetical protein